MSDSKPFAFTLAKAQSLVDEAIDRKGEDYVYHRPSMSDCLYVHHNNVWDEGQEEYVHADTGSQPGCVWGHVFLDGMSVDPALLAPVEGSGVAEALDLLEDEDVLTSVDALASAWAGAVQFYQDGGSPWGEARDKANQRLAQARKVTMDDKAAAAHLSLNY